MLEPGLARLVAELGVRPEQEVVVDPLSHYSTDPEIVAVTGYDPHPVTRSVSLTFYPGIRPLDDAAAGGRPPRRPAAPQQPRQLHAPGGAGGVARGRARPGGRQGAAAPPVAGPRVLGVAVEGRARPATPRAACAPIVVGDGDFASNSFFPYMANSDLLLSAVRWLAREERATAVATRIPVPPLIALTGRQSSIVFIIWSSLPLSVVALGCVVWWRRR